MLGIILTGHGGFASGLEQAMKQILGEQPQFIAIDFPETSTTARLTVPYRSAGRDAVSRCFYARYEKTGQRSDHRHQPAIAAGDGART